MAGRLRYVLQVLRPETVTLVSVTLYFRTPDSPFTAERRASP